MITSYRCLSCNYCFSVKKVPDKYYWIKCPVCGENRLCTGTNGILAITPRASYPIHGSKDCTVDNYPYEPELLYDKIKSVRRTKQVNLKRI